jgi:hypothetical protein
MEKMENKTKNENKINKNKQKIICGRLEGKQKISG